jgi:hypothetical protein
MSRLKSISDTNGEDRDKMLRTVAFDSIANIKQRIHVEGLNSDQQQIGEYSNSYMKVRRFYNRSSDKKVILSLTRNMENDFTVVGGSGATGYDLGFKNPDNAAKRERLEEKYGDVYKPTELEVAHMRVVAEQFINDLLNK